MHAGSRPPLSSTSAPVAITDNDFLLPTDTRKPASSLALPSGSSGPNASRFQVVRAVAVKCVVAGCGRKADRRGYCLQHFRQFDTPSMSKTLSVVAETALAEELADFTATSKFQLKIDTTPATSSSNNAGADVQGSPVSPAALQPGSARAVADSDSSTNRGSPQMTVGIKLPPKPSSQPHLRRQRSLSNPDISDQQKALLSALTAAANAEAAAAEAEPAAKAAETEIKVIEPQCGDVDVGIPPRRSLIITATRQFSNSGQPTSPLSPGTPLTPVESRKELEAKQAAEHQAAINAAIQRISLINKRCAVVGCNGGRDKQNYCLAHYALFTQTAPAEIRKIKDPKDKDKKAPPAPSLEVEITKVWQSAKEVVFKDLPRLAKRITVDKTVKDELGRPSTVVLVEHNEENTADMPRWTAIERVVNAVVSYYETPEKAAAVAQELKRIGETVDSTIDLHPSVEAVFTSHVGLESRSMQVFKAIHQSILFPAIMHLSTNIFAVVGPMKDVRRSDGWTVNVRLGDAVAITHKRWEQNLAPPESNEHFEVNWELRMTFDREMQKLRAVFLRILKLNLHPEMSAERKGLVIHHLKGDNFCVHGFIV